MNYSLDKDDNKGESLVNTKSVYSQFNGDKSITVENEESQIFNEKISMALLNNDLIALIGKSGNGDSGNLLNCYYQNKNNFSLKH